MQVEALMQIETAAVQLSTLAKGDTFIDGGNPAVVYEVADVANLTALGVSIPSGQVPRIRLSDASVQLTAGTSMVIPIPYKAVPV